MVLMKSWIVFIIFMVFIPFLVWVLMTSLLLFRIECEGLSSYCIFVSGFDGFMVLTRLMSYLHFHRLLDVYGVMV